MSFETRVLNELAAAFPVRAALCRGLVARMDDLIVPFRSFDLYHPEQRGSCSIKRALPAFTGRGCEGLSIQEGDQASREWLRAVGGGVAEDVKQEILQALRDYCRQDTLAMADLLRVLAAHA
jgi:hypothetical protein